MRQKALINLTTLNLMTMLARFVGGSTNPAMAREIPILKVGVVLPLSGPQGAFGNEALRGLELALNEFKQSNPEWANKVVLEVRDDKSQSKLAVEQAESLMTKGRVPIVIGSITTTTTVQMARIAEKLKRPLISPIATDPALIKSRYAFVVDTPLSTQGQALAEHAIKQFNARKVAIIAPEGVKSQESVAAFRKKAEQLGAKVVYQKNVPIEQTDFHQILADAKIKRAKAIFIPMAYSKAAKLMRQAQKINYRAHFLGTTKWDSPGLFKMAGKAAYGHAFTATFASDDPAPKVQPFIKAFMDEHGRPPGAVAALFYDSLGVITAAFARAKNILPKPFYRAIARTKSYQGVTGIISFNAKGHTMKSSIVKQTEKKGAKFIAHYITKGD